MTLAATVERLAAGEVAAKPTRAVLLRVYRHNPSTPGDTPKIVTYRVPVSFGMTVLDALIWAKEHVDPSLAFRCSCRMGICGSCGMQINGVPRLGCETQLTELGGDRVDVAPLANHPIVRDLATDFTGFFGKHRAVRPHVVRTDGEPAKIEREFLQTEEQKLAYYQFTMCIMCGLCNSACPIATMDAKFLGPQALAQAYRFTADSRDQGGDARLPVLEDHHGVWRCEIAGSCSAVCPKGVDPALGIQLLKRTLIGRRLGRA